MRRTLTIGLGFLLMIASAPIAGGDQPAPATQPAGDADPRSPTTARAAIVYDEPEDWGGMPDVLASGGRRTGTGDGGIDVLLPLASAADKPPPPVFTASPRPALYWFIADREAAQHSCEITLNDFEAQDSPLNTTLPPRSPGIQRCELPDDLVLQPGRAYELKVELRRHEMPERNPIVGGLFAYRPVPQDLQQRLDGASTEQRCAIFAEAGYWIDALDAISDAIEAAPDDPRLRRLRADLLRSGRLDHVADWELDQLNR